MKSFIVYYSHIGQNFVDGKIKNLEKGNTAVVAQIIKDCTGGELYQIEPLKDYPFDYKDCCDVAAQHKSLNVRPSLKGVLPDITPYDTIFIGYPCWWSTMPMPVYTFLEAMDFSGKKIIPFTTHEGSGFGTSLVDIRRECPKAQFGVALEVKGSEVNDCRQKVISWLNGQS